MTTTKKFYATVNRAENQICPRKRFQGYMLAARYAVLDTTLLNTAEVVTQLTGKADAAKREWMSS